MVVALGNDHAGFPLLAVVKSHVESLGHEVVDHGAYSSDPVDFPDVVDAVCSSIKSGVADRAVLVCGTGVGACIAANKLPGIRAAVCHDVFSAHQCVEHDDANVLCLGAMIIGPNIAFEMVTSFLSARFSTEEHFRRRVQKLHALERRSARELIAEDGAG